MRGQKLQPFADGIANGAQHVFSVVAFTCFYRLGERSPPLYCQSILARLPVWLVVAIHYRRDSAFLVPPFAVASLLALRSGQSSACCSLMAMLWMASHSCVRLDVLFCWSMIGSLPLARLC